MAPLRGQGVMLIDDLVDSRWSLTVAGRALRQAGERAPFFRWCLGNQAAELASAPAGG